MLKRLKLWWKSRFNVAVLTLKQGDTLIVMPSQPDYIISSEACNRIRAGFKALMPQAGEVIVLSQSMDLAVLSWSPKCDTQNCASPSTI